MDPTDVVLRFIEAVNRGAVEEIAALLTDDHLFIDSEGGEYHGRATVQKGWEAYFSVVPDYTIVVRQVLSAGNTVVVLGNASGTYSRDGTLLSENRWSTPAAWRAEERHGHLAVWQVFADNEPIRQLMRRRGDERP